MCLTSFNMPKVCHLGVPEHWWGILGRAGWEAMVVVDAAKLKRSEKVTSIVLNSA